ncbi:hypothetical protein OIU78_022266 [Salix suchowensis]|nr:hypothetical protein OIU78_022266 [Salix suchowensis]
MRWKPCRKKSSEGDLTGIENNINSVCSGMISESKFNDVGKPGTKTSVCRGNKTVLVDDNVAINEQGRNHGGCPVIPFLNEQMHLVENNITGSPKCTIREEESEGGLLTISGNEQSFDLKGDKCTKQDADIVTCTVQESCFLFVGNQHTLTAKDNATGSFNGTMDELKQNMDYVETVLSLSSVAPVQSVEKNLDTAFTGVNSRGAKENDLLRADTSCQPVQASGFFPLYDAVPDKGESELFGSTYGVLSGFEGLKSGGMENMDYNLLTS